MASQVTGLREARAASLALRSVDREVRSDINKQIRGTLNPIWKSEVEAKVSNSTERRVLGTGVRVASGTSPKLVGATSSKALSGGLKPSVSWPAFEFGTKNPNEKTTYSSISKKGKRFSVTRRTRRQLPTYRKRGHVLKPAATESGPRIFALFTQTAIRAIINAFEKGE